VATTRRDTVTSAWREGQGDSQRHWAETGSGRERAGLGTGREGGADGQDRDESTGAGGQGMGLEWVE
jgi:hypothetical protein